MSDFFAMGGYAAYVWSAYGITLVVLVVSAWTARRKRLEALEQARQLLAREPVRRQPTVRKVE